MPKMTWGKNDEKLDEKLDRMRRCLAGEEGWELGRAEIAADLRQVAGKIEEYMASEEIKPLLNQAVSVISAESGQTVGVIHDGGEVMTRFYLHFMRRAADLLEEGK